MSRRGRDQPEGGGAAAATGAIRPTSGERGKRRKGFRNVKSRGVGVEGDQMMADNELGGGAIVEKKKVRHASLPLGSETAMQRVMPKARNHGN